MSLLNPCSRTTTRNTALRVAAASSTNALSKGDNGFGQNYSLRFPMRTRKGTATVVMTYDGSAFEVEFAGRDGRAYALLPVPAGKLLVLRDAPELAAA